MAMEFDAYGNPYNTNTLWEVQDDFPDAPAPQPAPGQAISEWAMLARGKTLGKKCVALFTPPAFGVANQQLSPVDMLSLQGNDDNSLPLSLLLSPPKVVPPPVAGFPSSVQDVSGSQDNTQINAAAGFSFANSVAIIDWGIGGISNTVEADFGNGLCLNLSASWVRVRAMVESVNATTSLLAYELSAFIGPGRPKDINAQRTILPQLAVLGDGAESTIRPLPRFAKRCYITGMPAVNLVFVGHIRFYRDLSGTIPAGDIFFSANEHETAPIPNGAMYFSITNNSGFGTVVQAVFELSV